MAESLPGKESFSSCWVKHVPGCENSSFRFPNSLIDVSAYYYYFTILTLRAFILSDSFKYQLHAEDQQIYIFLKSRLHLAVPSASQHVPNRALSLPKPFPSPLLPKQILAASMTSLFLSCFLPGPLADPVSASFKIYPESNHFSPPTLNLCLSQSYLSPELLS